MFVNETMRSAAFALTRRLTSSSSSSTMMMRSMAPVSSMRYLSSETKDVLFEKVPKDDFGEFQEYSVIFTNRSLNLMSEPFQKVMRDLNTLLKQTYNADKVAIVPG